MAGIEAFKDNKRTYASYKNAKKIIDNLDINGDFSWMIGVTEEGRYFPHVTIHGTRENNFRYLINQGCCVTIV